MLLHLFLCAADEGETVGLVSILGGLVKGTLVKYWIFLCCSMFFVVSFSGKVQVYKILYIGLFLFCVVLYQVRTFLSSLYAYCLVSYVISETMNKLKQFKNLHVPYKKQI